VSESRITELLAATDAAEDAGLPEEMEVCAREGLALAIAAGAANQVVEFYAALARRMAYAEDWPGIVEMIKPGLAWLPRAQDPVACVRLAGMLALAHSSLRQFDRAFVLLRRVRAQHAQSSTEANYLLDVKLAEFNLHLGRTAEAAVFLRQAIDHLEACTEAQRTPHRIAISRLMLAMALLLGATAERPMGAPVRAADLDEALQRLDEAEPMMVHTPVLGASLVVARGYALSLQGRPDAALKARLLSLSDAELHRFVPATEPCVFDWVSVEAAAGDLGFAHAALARTDPRRLKLPWPHLKALWYRALGEVLAAEGDAPDAVQAMRQSMYEDRLNRDRETALMLEMAEHAAQAAEIEERERAALDRAETLAVDNATLAAESQRWSESALTDPLTGLRNRRYLEQVVAGLRAAGPAGDWTVAMIDIDHFKSVNDQHSHAVGDLVLAAVGRILGAAVRDEDVAARWGGEEFVLLLRQRVGEPRLDAVRQAVAAFDWSSLLPDRQITISLGATHWSGPAEFTQALAQADERLYEAKRAGRNRVVLG
jgi:diguanylate cyclase (GGDEF)-like protein